MFQFFLFPLSSFIDIHKINWKWVSYKVKIKLRFEWNIDKSFSLLNWLRNSPSSSRQILVETKSGYLSTCYPLLGLFTFWGKLVLLFLFVGSDEGLTFETSALKLFNGGQIYVINSVDIRLHFYILPSTQHHSFFRNLPPSLLTNCSVVANRHHISCFIKMLPLTFDPFSPHLPEETFFIGTLWSLNPARNEMVDSITI